MTDFRIFENGDGGQIQIKNNDIVLNGDLLQLVYLRLFGGNYEPREIAGKRFDYWGNDLFYPQTPTLQLISSTERKLSTTVLTEVGLSEISNGVREDLATLEQEGVIKLNSVDTQITGVNKVTISISIQEPDGESIDQTIRILYDTVRAELELIEAI